MTRVRWAPRSAARRGTSLAKLGKPDAARVAARVAHLAKPLNYAHGVTPLNVGVFQMEQMRSARNAMKRKTLKDTR